MRLICDNGVPDTRLAHVDRRTTDRGGRVLLLVTNAQSRDIKSRTVLKFCYIYSEEYLLFLGWINKPNATVISRGGASEKLDFCDIYHILLKK